MTTGWGRLTTSALAFAGLTWISGLTWASTAAAQTTLADPFAPAAGSVAENGAKAAPAEEKKAAPKASKPRAHKDGGSTIAVAIYNKRSVGLVELTAAIAGTSDAKKIAGPLAINRKTVAHLKHDKSCLFDLKGSYADGADLDMPGVELCKDKVINLTDE